jgi:transcriptional regulator with GAF, ATPase, and Fis domain
MLEVWKAIGRAASSDVPVLITGESGVGKDVVAQTIHAHSARASSPFMAVNVAALSSGVIESELFGHERGAFTGATQARAGRFELAGNGVIFLDEIGDLDLALQAKLLRVLERRVRACGWQHRVEIQSARHGRDGASREARLDGELASR